MQQSCWTVSKETGFLMNPAPIVDLRTIDCGVSAEMLDHLQTTADQLPSLLANRTIRPTLDGLPHASLDSLREVDDFRIVERFFQLYAHFAQAYVWAEEDNPATFIPASVAVPFVQVARMVARPPIIVYAMTALSNWQKVDPAGGMVVDNLRVVQKLIDIPDESWFHLTHVEIEAIGGDALAGCFDATSAVERGDVVSAENALLQIADALSRMHATFRQITKGCSPDLYYHTLRPFLFGFNQIVFEGVAEYDGKPQTLRGETGAQSSLIPTIQNFIGLEHSFGGLSEYLEEMKLYMPQPHRELLTTIDQTKIRRWVAQQTSQPLRDAYNLCLQRVVEFRTLHLNYAHAYIASKVKNPTGTGGTEFMRWLKQLRDETAEQYL